jgi:hypothetical protein
MKNVVFCDVTLRDSCLELRFRCNISPPSSGWKERISTRSHAPEDDILDRDWDLCLFNMKANCGRADNAECLRATSSRDDEITVNSLIADIAKAFGFVCCITGIALYFICMGCSYLTENAPMEFHSLLRISPFLYVDNVRTSQETWASKVCYRYRFTSFAFLLHILMGIVPVHY